MVLIINQHEPITCGLLNFTTGESSTPKLKLCTMAAGEMPISFSRSSRENFCRSVTDTMPNVFSRPQVAHPIPEMKKQIQKIHLGVYID